MCIYKIWKIIKIIKQKSLLIPFPRDGQYLTYLTSIKSILPMNTLHQRLGLCHTLGVRCPSRSSHPPSQASLPLPARGALTQPPQPGCREGTGGSLEAGTSECSSSPADATPPPWLQSQPTPTFHGPVPWGRLPQSCFRRLPSAPRPSRTFSSLSYPTRSTSGSLAHLKVPCVFLNLSWEPVPCTPFFSEHLVQFLFHCGCWPTSTIPNCMLCLLLRQGVRAGGGRQTKGDEPLILGGLCGQTTVSCS